MANKQGPTDNPENSWEINHKTYEESETEDVFGSNSSQNFNSYLVNQEPDEDDDDDDDYDDDDYDDDDDDEDDDDDDDDYDDDEDDDDDDDEESEEENVSRGRKAKELCYIYANSAKKKL